MVDSQSVKASAAKERGYDAFKKVRGRKRHIAVNTDGRLLGVNLTPADVADSTGALAVLDALKQKWPGLKHLFGDAADDHRALRDKAACLDFTVEVVRRLRGQALRDALTVELADVESQIYELVWSNSAKSDDVLNDLRVHHVAKVALYSGLASINEVLGWVRLMAEKDSDGNTAEVVKSLPSIPLFSLH